MSMINAQSTLSIKDYISVYSTLVLGLIILHYFCIHNEFSHANEKKKKEITIPFALEYFENSKLKI